MDVSLEEAKEVISRLAGGTEEQKAALRYLQKKWREEAPPDMTLATFYARTGGIISLKTTPWGGQ